MTMTILPATAAVSAVDTLISACRDYLLELERTEQLRIRCDHALKTLEHLTSTALATFKFNTEQVSVLCETIRALEGAQEIQMQLVQLVGRVVDREDSFLTGFLANSAAALGQPTAPRELS